MTTCSVEGCEGRCLARGMCSKHYQRWRNENNRPCRVGGCARGVAADDLCNTHYNRVKTTGSVDGRKPLTFAERFWSHCEPDPESDCLVYEGAATYVTVKLPSGRKATAHRVAYALTNGPIPDGLVVDHLCNNPPCVRPDHLEAKTQRENVLRSGAPSAENARKRACKRGHPLDGDNLYIHQGRRHCKACRREYQRAS